MGGASLKAETGEPREGDALGVVAEHEEIEAVGDRGGAASGLAGAFDGAVDGEQRRRLPGTAPAVDQHRAGALADHPGPGSAVDPPVAERVEQRRHVVEPLQPDAAEVRGEEPIGRFPSILLVASGRGQHRAHVPAQGLDRHGANRVSTSAHRVPLVPWRRTIIRVRRHQESDDNPRCVTTAEPRELEVLP